MLHSMRSLLLNTMIYLFGVSFSAYSYQFIIDTDPSNGFGNIDPTNTVIQGQTSHVDVSLLREAGDEPADAYGIALEFNDLDAVLSTRAINPVNAYAAAPGANAIALDGSTIDLPTDLDTAGFGFHPLTSGTNAMVPLLTGNNSPSAAGVNGFVFQSTTGGHGIFSDSTTPFGISDGELMLLEAIYFNADQVGNTDIGVAGVYNFFAANNVSTSQGAAAANNNQMANAFPLYNSAGGISRAFGGTTFVNGHIIVAVPEASSMGLLSMGFIGLMLFRWRTGRS